MKCIWPAEGHTFPVIKCKGFFFGVGRELHTIKKWKDVPFKMESLLTWLNEEDSSSDES